jgi:hypothetical protein
MCKLIDLTGKRFGKLTVIKKVKSHVAPNGHASTMWECKCDCGNIINVCSYDLRSGHSKSCGCLQFIHGLSKSHLYGTLNRMYSRCYDQSNRDYKYYGIRGIKLCDEWNKDVVGKKHSMENFYKWAMKNGYKKGLTIDRKNNNGNYEPLNCRWATMQTQSNNRRNNHFVYFKNERLTISQLARKYHVNRDLLKGRLQRNWDVEKAITEPVKG